jgi:hypothetical protein
MVSYLLFPCFQFLHQEVVAFGDLGQLGIETPLEVDEILPSFHGISGILIPFANNFVQMSHGNLCHKWFLHRATKDGLDASVASLMYISESAN